MPETVSVPTTKLEMTYFTLKYQCPRCKRASTISLPYAQDYKGLSYEKKGFCSNRYCEASHHFKYSVTYPNGEMKLKVSKFFVDNEEAKVQVLA